MSAKRSKKEVPPSSFAYVHDRELEELQASRELRTRRSTCPKSLVSHTHLEPNQTVGLAFSGGGIRSATFNLGVLQGLAELGLLPIFDYLSTVSGGGYIGSWLTAWISRTAGVQDVEDVLQNSATFVGGDTEPHEIRALREYSNYLTPKLGLLSGDTWAFIGAYVRNLILNQLVLVLVLLSVLLLPRPFILYFILIATTNHPLMLIPIVAIALLMISAITSVAALPNGPENRPKTKLRQIRLGSRAVDSLVIAPLVAGLWLLWPWWWSVYRAQDMNANDFAFLLGLSLAAIWVAAWLIGNLCKYLLPWLSLKPLDDGVSAKQIDFTEPTGWSWRDHLAELAGLAFIAGAAGGYILYGLTRAFDRWSEQSFNWPLLSWGFPVVVLVFLLIETLHIGLMGGDFSEDVREWWGRVGGTIAIIVVCGSLLYAIAVHGPQLFQWATRSDGHSLRKWAVGLVGSAWAAITGLGVSTAKEGKESLPGIKLKPKTIAMVAPPVFILGLLILLSCLIDWKIAYITNSFHLIPHVWGADKLDFLTTSVAHIQYFKDFNNSLDECLWVFIFGLFAVSFLLSWRIGINRFSMHSLYRNRLVRCYLGASHKRNPQPYIGIDDEDDAVHVAALLAHRHYAGPYPIYNTALNLVDSNNLAWQQRKAASFVFTPLYTGFEFRDPNGGTVSALRQTREFKIPLTLGSATAISGAAVAPNMGAASSGSLAFLMTIFNVRLGWWLGNPLRSTWRRQGPVWGLFYLLCELLERTNHESRYVYLSDGGHFENLGIYELIRRRCRFIVVCDASEDHSLQFGDLGNAIEKCRTDFGVDIEIDIEPIRLQADTKKSKWHCAVGKIHYENVDKGLDCGTIVYLKSTMTGDESTDVQRYADQNLRFPHQSTADQWFDESQFESYRALGRHVALNTFGAVGNAREIADLDIESLFVKLRQQWYPPSRFIQTSFTKHTATYTTMLERMRTDPLLHFLDRQVYPQWVGLDAGVERKSGYWLPTSEEERRAGFYLCNEVIQLMEDAYLDLNLEAEFDHPDNRGWMNLFRHWSWSGMFCATWAMSASIYGIRFQNFCERRLDLRPGHVQIRKPVANLKLAIHLTDSQRGALERECGLDFFEIELLDIFLEHGRDFTRPDMNPDSVRLTNLKVIPFQMVAESPRREHRERIKFNVGFAVCAVDESGRVRLCYFRTRDHLRRMGVAHGALEKLLADYKAPKFDICPARGRQFAASLAAGASRLEALPSQESVRRFEALFRSVCSSVEMRQRS